MQRAIVAPAMLPGAALDELKDWLAITTAREDAALNALLRTALETCEAFTRQVPVEATFEEIGAADAQWHSLRTAPVRAITSVEGIANDGTRFGIDPMQYLTDLAADGRGRIKVLKNQVAGRIAVRFTAGIAPDWGTLPDGLKHGIIRLAAHHHRARDEAVGTTQPPASIAALWQPWRRMRLA